MQIKLSPHHIQTILSEAQAAAKRLHRRLGPASPGQDDLCQDLLIDLLRRLPAFDPKRGSLGAFSGLILRNQASRIAMRTMKERRAQGGTMLSLDAPLSQVDPRPMSEVLSNRDGLGAWHGQNVDARLATEHSIDTGRALGCLSPRDRAICAGLAHSSVATLARRGFGSRSALYRRISNLRFALALHGLGPTWDETGRA